MVEEQLLDICLKVTGSFEGGSPRYDALTGDSDGQGISAGILQWNLGQGTLQELVRRIGTAMGWDKAKVIIPMGDLQALSRMAPHSAVAYAHEHYLSSLDYRRIRPAAVAAWKAFLISPESIAAQQQYAVQTVLASAHHLANKFVPEAANRTRVIAFFFDLVTQQGSMRTVQPLEGPASSGPVLFYAAGQNLACTNKWRAVVATDELAKKLLYYAFERGRLGNPAYMWDSVSRRGTIATRVGIVHQTPIDLTALLD